MVVLEMALGLALALVLLVGCGGALRWNELRYRRKGLPPGTMGWPILGETTEFLKQGPGFMKNQSARHGNLFKTHILGCPTVICMDPDLNRFILLNEKKGLVPGYPQSMLDILGRSNIAAVGGKLHKVMRGALLALISPIMIRDRLLPKIDGFMSSHLSGWSGKVVDIQEKTKEMALLSSLKQIAGIQSGPISDGIKREYLKLALGVLSLPIDLPSTNYRRGLQGRKGLVSILKQIIAERRASPNLHDDMLENLLRMGEKSRTKLTEEEIVDLIIAIIYSGYETVSTTSMMCVKYLSVNPTALQQLRKEHMDIRGRKSADDAVDWNDLKAMTFTRAVIYESMRLATVVNGLLRKTTHDIEINGFVIPKGWRIYVYTGQINHDPALHSDPLIFNPWRWLEQTNHLESHNYFLLFGGGGRLCPGKELAVAEISTFLHYLVTRYRWEEVGTQTLLTFPRVEAPNGLHIRVSDSY